MRSIRLSLIVYFLLLQLVAHLAAAALVMRNTHAGLRKEALVNRELRTRQFQDLRREEEQKLDRLLYEQARRVADLAQSQSQWSRVRAVPLLSLGTLSAGLAPQGHVLIPTYAAEATSHPLYWSVADRLLREIHFSEELLPRDTTGTLTEHFQIDGNWQGAHWISPSLAGQALPFDPSLFDTLGQYEYRHDDVPIPGERSLGRRVMFRATMDRFRFARGPRRPNDRPNPPGDRGPDRPPPEPPPSRVPNAPWSVIVQCACSAEVRDRAIADLAHDQVLQIAADDAQSEATLHEVRRSLLMIALATFAATVLGGSLFVGLGLAPLKRLADAVSRVSPRDFKLDTGPGVLPRELRPIAGRLGETLDQLRRAFEREKRSAADISHELRTPVAALLTTLDVALRKQRSADDYRTTLTESRAIAIQMKELVERLLALARLDAGVDMLRPQPFDVGTLLEQCATLIGPLAREANVELRTSCPKPVIWTTDADKLREILINLLHNAVEYNHDGGSIDVIAHDDGGFLDVQVTDTGTGIAPEVLDRVWERFYRADPSRQACEMHAGLGLSIIKGYADLLGGDVSVQSRVGQGSTFRVRLPRL